MISRNGSVCNIYVRGTDNALWQKGWFGNAWHDWAGTTTAACWPPSPRRGRWARTMSTSSSAAPTIRSTRSSGRDEGLVRLVRAGRPSGGFQGAPAVISRNNTVCNIYVRGTDNALWQKAWFNNAWHDWGRHNDGGVLASEPAPGSMGPNHEHVFVRGTDNQVWQKWWNG